jgi:hypothetical protein
MQSVFQARKIWFTKISLSIITIITVITGPMVLIGPTVLTGHNDFLPAQVTNLRDVPRDLSVPPLSNTQPSPGTRTKLTTATYPEDSVYHILSLPANWQPGQKYPILVEFAGNGNYSNALGDLSTGKPEGCVIGYGLSGGQDYIWLVLPYVEKRADGSLANCLQWWGDMAETKQYCLKTIESVCLNYGGDSNRIVLCGFSRGSIGCNFFGLHDDEIAQIWCGFFCHSHYDGVRMWPYQGSDRAAALTRLKRLGHRPQWISHEESIADVENYLRSIEIDGIAVANQCTFEKIPFANHSAEWLLCDLPQRESARKWLRRVLAEANTRPTKN